MNKNYVALVTPFDENGINFDALNNLIDFVCGEGADGIVLLGTTGEASTVTAQERSAIIKFAKRSRHKPEIIVGCSSNCTKTAAENARRAELLGANAVLAITPYYNKCNDEGAYLHFKTIMRSVEIPVVLYNVPQRTGYNLGCGVASRLMDEKNMAGVKEAGSINRCIDFIAKGIPVYCGEDNLTIPFMACGAKGTISVVANLLPSFVSAIVKNCENAGKHLNIMYEISNLLFSDVNPIPIKFALNLIGINAGNPRLPLTPLSHEKGLLIKKWLDSHCDLIPEKYRQSLDCKSTVECSDMRISTR